MHSPDPLPDFPVDHAPTANVNQTDDTRQMRSIDPPVPVTARPAKRIVLWLRSCSEAQVAEMRCAWQRSSSRFCSGWVSLVLNGRILRCVVMAAFRPISSCRRAGGRDPGLQSGGHAGRCLPQPGGISKCRMPMAVGSTRSGPLNPGSFRPGPAWDPKRTGVCSTAPASSWLAVLDMPGSQWRREGHEKVPEQVVRDDKGKVRPRNDSDDHHFTLPTRQESQKGVKGRG